MGSFLLVIPFHTADRGQVERLGKWMRALSGGKRIGERILFVATVGSEIKGIGDNFVGLFDKIEGIQQTSGPSLQPGENPWPKACNLQFLHAAKHIHENYPDVDAFYYFEPDNLPLRSDWWEVVQEDYRKQQKPFWGAEVKARGNHMIGTGIYPQDAWTRVKGYAEIEKNQPGEPWDVLTYAEVNPQCHFTPLVQHIHSSRGFKADGTAVYRTPIDPEIKRRPVTFSRDAVIFHGCKDSSLRLLWAKKLDIPQNDILTFAHSGDLGDLIYALASIKEKGGGILKLSQRFSGREKLTPPRIAAIRPLLESQDYIDSVVLHEGEYTDFDLRSFRILHGQRGNLVKTQADWIGCPLTVGDTPWLSNIPKKRVSRFIVNRTARYRNDAFPWKALASMNPEASFIGTPAEHDDMLEIWNLAHVESKSLLDAAAMIAGSEKFIGNQSACFALAEGMKHPRIQETCLEAMDCIFDSETGVYCMDDRLDLSGFRSASSDVPLDKSILEQLLDDPRFQIKVNRLIDLKLEEILK